MVTSTRCDRPRAARFALAVAALATTPLSCAPSLPSLVRDRHYLDALCGASEERPSQPALETVQRALDADVHPQLHATVASRAMLQRAAPALSERVASETVALRVTVRTNAVYPIEYVELTPRLVRASSAVPAVALDYASLAVFTHEIVPRGRVSGGPGPIEGFVYGVAGATHAVARSSALVLDLATLGFFNFGGMLGSAPRAGSRATYTPPSRAELERAIPDALRLSIALRDERRECRRLGADCATWLLYARPADEATGPYALELEFDASSTLSCRRPGPRSARVWQIPLPPGPTLEARVDALFGEAMRPVAALPGVTARITR